MSLKEFRPPTACVECGVSSPDWVSSTNVYRPAALVPQSRGPLVARLHTCKCSDCGHEMVLKHKLVSSGGRPAHG